MFLMLKDVSMKVTPVMIDFMLRSIRPSVLLIIVVNVIIFDGIGAGSQSVSC